MTSPPKGESPAHVASLSEIIITMLPNSPQVEEVILAKQGVLEGASPGSLDAPVNCWSLSFLFHIFR